MIKYIMWILSSIAIILVGAVWLNAGEPPQQTPAESDRSPISSPASTSGGLQRASSSNQGRLVSSHVLDTFSIVPAVVFAGTSQPITFTASISDPAVIRTSVTLLLSSSTGANVIGIMNDAGLNGDVTAGDNIFTLIKTLSQYPAGPLRFRVSAAYRGELQRTQSGEQVVLVQTGQPTANWLNLTDSQRLFYVKAPANVRIVELFASAMEDGYALKDVVLTSMDSAGTITDLLVISVFSKVGWRELQRSNTPSPVYIAETATSVFAYSLPEDLSDEQRSMARQIAATFTAQ